MTYFSVNDFNRFFRLSIIVVVSIVWFASLNAQHRIDQDDLVTFTDFRKVYSVDFGPREVYFATDRGIWRIDRFTGESLNPLTWGNMLERAIRIERGKIIHWHWTTSTLWLVTWNSLIYYRRDIERWYLFEGLPAGNIKAIGSNDGEIIVELASENKPFIVIDPFIFRVKKRTKDAPEGVRWSGRWKPHGYLNYRVSDFDFSFDPSGGAVTDWKLNKFDPTYDALDERYDKRYLCYPGLGIGVADERHLRLDVIQPGPTGRDVKAIAIDSDGFMWIGGENRINNSGINLYDRETGLWQYFDSELIFGMDSDVARDVALYKGNAYFASDVGLVYYKSSSREWKTVDRFDGLIGLDLRALAVAGGQIFAGGDIGINRMTLPAGPVFNIGDENLAGLRTADAVSDGDTVWVASLQGLFRGEPTGTWSMIGSDEQTVGNEAARSLAVIPTHIWTGGQRGIRELNRKTGKWVGYLGSIFLRGGMPLSIAANDSLLWVGTDRGLFVHNRKTGGWLSYGEFDGLPSNRIQAIVLEADTLWIGSPEGLTRFIWNRPERDVY